MKPFLPLSDKTRAEMEATYPFLPIVKDNVLSALAKTDNAERMKILFSALRKTESSVSAELSRLRSRPNRATKFSIVLKRIITILKLGLDTLPEDAQSLAYPTLALISTHFVNIILPSSLKTTALPKFVACHLYAFLKSAFSNDLEFVLDILVCSNVFEDAESDQGDNHSMGFYILLEAMLDGYLYSSDTPAFAKYLTVLSIVREITNGGDEGFQRTLRDLDGQSVFHPRDVIKHLESNFGIVVTKKKKEPSWREIIKRIKPRKIANVTRHQRLTVISGSGALQKKKKKNGSQESSEDDSPITSGIGSSQSSLFSFSGKGSDKPLFFMDRGEGESQVSSSDGAVPIKYGYDSDEVEEIRIKETSPKKCSSTKSQDIDPFNILPPFEEDEEEEVKEVEFVKKPSPRKSVSFLENNKEASDEVDRKKSPSPKKASSPRKMQPVLPDETEEIPRKASSPSKKLSFFEQVFDQEESDEEEVLKKRGTSHKKRLTSITSSTDGEHDLDKLLKLSPRKSFLDSPEQGHESDSDEPEVLYEERATPKKKHSRGSHSKQKAPISSDSEEDDGIDSDQESRDFAPSESGEDEVPEYSPEDYGFRSSSSAQDTSGTTEENDDAVNPEFSLQDAEAETRPMEVDFVEDSKAKNEAQISTSSSPTRRTRQGAKDGGSSGENSEDKSPVKRKRLSSKLDASSSSSLCTTLEMSPENSPKKEVQVLSSPPKKSVSPTRSPMVSPSKAAAPPLPPSPRRLRTRSDSGSTTGTIPSPVKVTSKGNSRAKKELSPLKEESPKKSSPSSPPPTKRGGRGRKSTTVTTPAAGTLTKGRTGRGRKSAAAEETLEDSSTKKVAGRGRKRLAEESTTSDVVILPAESSASVVTTEETGKGATKKGRPPKQSAKKEIRPNLRTTRSTRARAVKKVK